MIPFPGAPRLAAERAAGPDGARALRLGPRRRAHGERTPGTLGPHPEGTI